MSFISRGVSARSAENTDDEAEIGEPLFTTTAMYPFSEFISFICAPDSYAANDTGAFFLDELAAEAALPKIRDIGRNQRKV